MSDEATVGLPLFDAMERLTPRRRKLIQRLVVRRMKRQGKVDDETGKKLQDGEWQDFLDWILENAPAIIEFIMSILVLFGI